MDYNATDSSGTDDDLPPTHQSRYARNARVTGNGRSAIAGSTPYSRMLTNDMEPEIHNIEQEAYYHVLRAFKAQSDAITWEKEGLITELRKELRVSDEEHRELLSKVNNDDTIQRIREWRKGHGSQSGGMSSSQHVRDSIPSPTVSASRKKSKTGQSAGSLSAGPPPPLHPPMQPTSSLKRGPSTGGRGKKSKSMLYPPASQTGRPLTANRGSAFGASEPSEAAKYDPLIGRKVWTRWPEDNNFYEAVVTDVKEGRHALVYDINTATEAWEWVDLKEISPQDIRWEGEDPGISQRASRPGPGPGRGSKKPSVRGGAVGAPGRGRGTLKGIPKKDIVPPQNGIVRKELSSIELLHTDTLIKEVEKVFGGSHPDPAEVEKAKKVLKEHEQALIEAIARLEDASDGETDEGDHPFSQGHSMDRELGWRKRQYDEMRGNGRGGEGADGDKGRQATEKQLEV